MSIFRPYVISWGSKWVILRVWISQLRFTLTLQASNVNNDVFQLFAKTQFFLTFLPKLKIFRLKSFNTADYVSRIIKEWFGGNINWWGIPVAYLTNIALCMSYGAHCLSCIFLKHIFKLSITAPKDATGQSVFDPSSQCELLSDTSDKIFRQDDGRPAPPLPNSEFQMEPLVMTNEVVYSFQINLDIHKSGSTHKFF